MLIRILISIGFSFSAPKDEYATLADLDQNVFKKGGGKDEKGKTEAKPKAKGGMGTHILDREF